MKKIFATLITIGGFTAICSAQVDNKGAEGLLAPQENSAAQSSKDEQQKQQELKKMNDSRLQEERSQSDVEKQILISQQKVDERIETIKNNPKLTDDQKKAEISKMEEERKLLSKRMMAQDKARQLKKSEVPAEKKKQSIQAEKVD